MKLLKFWFRDFFYLRNYWNLECIWNLDVYLDIFMFLFYFKNLYGLCKNHEFSMDYVWFMKIKKYMGTHEYSWIPQYPRVPIKWVPTRVWGRHKYHIYPMGRGRVSYYLYPLTSLVSPTWFFPTASCWNFYSFNQPKPNRPYYPLDSYPPSPQCSCSEQILARLSSSNHPFMHLQ